MLKKVLLVSLILAVNYNCMAQILYSYNKYSYHLCELKYKGKDIVLYSSPTKEFSDTLLHIFPDKVEYKDTFKLIFGKSSDGYSPTTHEYGWFEDIAIQDYPKDNNTSIYSDNIPYNCFIIHKNGKCVNGYSYPPKDNYNPIVVFYPYKAEANAGAEVLLKGVVDNFLNIDLMGNDLYLRQGTLGVFIKGNARVFREPDYESMVMDIVTIPRLGIITDYANGWMKLTYIKDDKCFEGWLPQEAQHGSQWIDAGNVD